MLSNKIITACEGILTLGEQAREMIERETNEDYSICYQPYVQLWANPDVPHDLKKLEDLVGPIKFKYQVEGTDAKAYTFKLGKADGIIIMPPHTTDSRGASNDVSSNT